MGITKIDNSDLHFVCSGYIQDQGSCGLERKIDLSTLDIQANENLAYVRLPECEGCGGSTCIIPTAMRDLKKDRIRRVLFRRVFELGRFADEDSQRNAMVAEKALSKFEDKDSEVSSSSSVNVAGVE